MSGIKAMQSSDSLLDLDHIRQKVFITLLVVTPSSHD